MHSKPNIVQKVLRKGAGGYLLKNAIGEELMLAVQAASQNEIYLSPSISGALLEDLWGLQKKMGDNMTTDLLTSREQQVLQLIAEGYTNNEIADKLVVSVKTVEKHRANLMGKLGIHDVAGLMREAIKHDLIFVDPL
jgi:DNA-binding NarL/FixJ family response regulator